MVCIIATIVLPEPLRRTSLVKIEDDRREKCVRNPDTLRFAVILFWSAVAGQPIPSRRELSKPPPSRLIRPISPRIASWRGTGKDIRSGRWTGRRCVITNSRVRWYAQAVTDIKVARLVFQTGRSRKNEFGLLDLFGSAAVKGNSAKSLI